MTVCFKIIKKQTLFFDKIIQKQVNYQQNYKKMRLDYESGTKAISSRFKTRQA